MTAHQVVQTPRCVIQANLYNYRVREFYSKVHLLLLHQSVRVMVKSHFFY